MYVSDKEREGGTDEGDGEEKERGR